ncbi:hypothetical protein ACQY0O_007968 [Thecaphora frezii]
MRASSVLRIHRVFPRHRKTNQDSIGSLLRDRLQTSLDGVVRESASAQPISPSALRHSRNGLLALFGWIAIVSYLEGPASQAHVPQISITSPALIPILRSGDGSLSNARPYSTSSTRRLHTSASSSKPASARRLQDSILSDSHGQPLLDAGSAASSAASAASPSSLRQRARYGSLAHVPEAHGSWWNRIGLSFLRSSSNVAEDGVSTRSKKASAALQGKGKIYDHMRHPSLYEPVLVPRHPIVLCHGLYGFDVRGPFFGLEIHYWANVLDILRKKVGADVLIHGVPPTGSIQERAEALHRFLCSEEAGVRGKKLNFIGHSMGGLDVRHLITNIKPKPEEYIPISLTTISTPHRGSPFMDWCNANIGIGNEYIERALEEARAQRSNPSQPIGSRGPMRLPYSLKTPLFTRPKSDKRSSSNSNRNGGDAQATEKGGTSSASKDGKVSGTEATGVAAASAVLEAVDKTVEAVGISRERGSDRAHEDVRESENRVASSIKGSIKEGDKSGSLLPFGLSSFAKALSSLSGSFSAYMLSLLDTPAYAMLATTYMAEVFNPATPNSPHVKYYSVAARTPSLAIWHPLWLPKLILDAAAESRTTGGESDGSADALGGQNQGNDGLVSVESAKWGEFLGIMEGCDHWDLRGGGAPRWKGKVNPATGKPYPTKAEMANQAESSVSSQKPKESTSWIDINRLLFSGQRDKDEASRVADAQRQSAEESGGSDGSDGSGVDATAATGSPIKPPQKYHAMESSDGWSGVRLQDPEREEASRGVHDGEDKSVGSSFTPQQDVTLVNDIAAWISDRLPERNDERRAQAAERDKLISQMSLTLYQPDAVGLTEEKPLLPPPPATATATEDLDTDAEWQGSDVAGAAVGGMPTRHSAAASSTIQPTEGRTVDSVPTSPSPPSSAPSNDASAKSAPPTSGANGAAEGKKPPSAQPGELERFWVALCRHLYVEGF